MVIILSWPSGSLLAEALASATDSERCA